MIDRNQRIAVAGLLLAAVIGCDSNPEGPKAPTKASPEAGAQPVVPKAGKMTKKGGGPPKSVSGPTPNAP